MTLEALTTSRDSQGGDPDARFVPLEREERVSVDTETAAHHLVRRPQTLRIWACKENGPLRPVRVHGRLMWQVADIRRLLGVDVRASAGSVEAAS